MSYLIVTITIIIIILVICIMCFNTSTNKNSGMMTDIEGMDDIKSIPYNLENSTSWTKSDIDMMDIDRDYNIKDPYNDLAEPGNGPNVGGSDHEFLELTSGLSQYEYPIKYNPQGVLNSGIPPYDVIRTQRNVPSFEQIEKDRILNNINSDLFTDRTFWDVVVYENDPYNGRLGLDKCLDNKVGTCVPYGNMTGIAYYYPPAYDDKNFGTMLNDELTPVERAEPNSGLMSFPNLR